MMLKHEQDLHTVRRLGTVWNLRPDGLRPEHKLVHVELLVSCKNTQLLILRHQTSGCPWTVCCLNCLLSIRWEKFGSVLKPFFSKLCCHVSSHMEEVNPSEALNFKLSHVCLNLLSLVFKEVIKTNNKWNLLLLRLLTLMKKQSKHFTILNKRIIKNKYVLIQKQNYSE